MVFRTATTAADQGTQTLPSLGQRVSRRSQGSTVLTGPQSEQLAGTGEAAAASSSPGVPVMLRDGAHWRLAQQCPADMALRILDVLTDDPGCWHDILALWPRSRPLDHSDGRLLEDIHWADVDAAAWQTFQHQDAWLAVDLVQCRLLLGARFNQLDVRLPPWWQCDRSGTPQLIQHERPGRWQLPSPARDVLWGQPLCQYFASELLDRVWQHGQIDLQPFTTPQARYEATVEIHRDWLLTPRLDLDGRMPRQVLHEAIDWVEDVSMSQSSAIAAGQAAIPIPTTLTTFLRAPWGFNEMVMYFDACRATLEKGWELIQTWADQPSHLPSGTRTRIENTLWQSLREHLHLCLVNDTDEPWTPAEVIQQERLRVPLVESGEFQPLDCDCPICRSMASEQWGPSFVHFNGYALEMDGQFAFSRFTSEAAWEQSLDLWEPADRTPHPNDNQATSTGPGLLADVTSAAVSAAYRDSWIQPLPDGFPTGDGNGKIDTLLMSFQLAEIVAVLEDSRQHQPIIDALNRAFESLRTEDRRQRELGVRQFADLLQQAGQQCPSVDRLTHSLRDKLIQELVF